MAGHEKIPGPIARNVSAGVRRERRRLDLTAAELSARLTEVGAPLLDTGIHKIEGGQRRVDADDLAALAVALDTPPNALLLPAADGATDYDQPVRLTPGYETTARRAWQWAAGEHPLADVDAMDEARFAQRGRPHRGQLVITADREQLQRQTQGDLFSLVIGAMAAGLPVDKLRSMFEHAIATGLISGLVPSVVAPAAAG